MEYGYAFLYKVMINVIYLLSLPLCFWVYLSLSLAHSHHHHHECGHSVCKVNMKKHLESLSNVNLLSFELT
jgi:hypothetical protein